MTAALVIVCAPVSGLRVSSCCRCPWQPQCLGTLGHHSLERTLVSAPFQSVPLLPRPKKQNAPRSFGTGLKIKILAQGEFNPSLPRSSTLDLPPALSSNSAS